VPSRLISGSEPVSTSVSGRDLPKCRSARSMRSSSADIPKRARADLFNEKVLDDPFARSFAGFGNDEDLLNALKAMVYPDFQRMRTLFALRNRYAEDELVRTIERGISQYVILGAGLDSFAFRRPDLLQR
jgi:O-methyltransferase involved in polyketide biosynthesis